MRGCPVDHQAMVESWAEGSLLCSAGRRAMKLKRYLIRPVRDGSDLHAGLDEFVAAARAHDSTGFLAVVGGTDALKTARDEVEHLSRLVAAAGLVDTPETAMAGADIQIPVRMRCPVTGRETTYTFFPVAFCRNASNPDDPLYDPALSCPFTAINTTSDAFAFALLVRDRSRRHFGCEPFEIDDAEACRALFDASVIIWQNMSVNTMKAFARLSVDPTRAVGLTPDHRYWTAPHKDPVFTETEKRPYAHEMPVIYARSLVEKWFAAMYDGDDVPIGLEGQSGGVPIARNQGILNELQ